jgi:hypothetical protein
MFCERISQVVLTWPVINQKLALASTIFQPMPPHGHGLGAFLFHGAIGKTFGGGVVDLHRC